MKGRPRVRVDPCKFCSKEFKRQEHLDRHLRTHTQEKPFGCACGRLFSRQDLLHRHRRLTQCNSPNYPSHDAGSPSQGAPGTSVNVIAHTTTQPGGGQAQDPLPAYPASLPSHPPRTSQAAVSHAGFSQDMAGIIPEGSQGSDVEMQLGMGMSLDHPTDFGQGMSQFDLDFLSNETDLISNYLIGMFPPRDSPQQISMQDEPCSFVASTEFAVGAANTVMMDPAIIEQSSIRPPEQPRQQTMPLQPLSEQMPMRRAPNSISTGVSNTGNAEARDEETPQAQPMSTTATPATEEVFDASPDASLDAPLEGLHAMADEIASSSNPWVISPAAFTRLESLVQKHASPSTEPGRPYRLPSRQVLSRYVMNFVRSFHPHLPFLHLGTTRLDDLNPVLLLTLAATGSFYGFEHTRGYAMYAVAKSVILYELEQRRRPKTVHLTQSFPAYAEIPMPMSTMSVSGEPQIARMTAETAENGQQSQHISHDSSDAVLLKCLLVLLLTMLWLDAPLMEDALAMSSQLTELLRDTLREEDDECANEEDDINDGESGNDDEDDGERENQAYNDKGQDTAWKLWGQREERLRTLYSAYFVLNILAICFDVPHPMSSRELDLALPSSEAEFAAPTWIAWLRLRRSKKKASQKSQQNASDNQRPRFLECLHQLLSGQRLAKEVAAREYGNYMLVQTLVIHINRERQVMADRPALNTSTASFTSLPPDIVSLYARALNAWQAGWDSAIDASPLDPNAVHGPLAFNATAMLRLAHVQLVMGWSSTPVCRRSKLPRHLRCREPRKLALGWPGQPQSSPSPHLSPRSPHVNQAVVHAICALRIPVRVGIPFVARGRTGHWSVQHALSTLSCAQLLAHWLEAIYEAVRDGIPTGSPTGTSSVASTPQNSSGIDVLRNEEKILLKMVESLIEETHLAESLGQAGSYPDRIRRLTVAALKLWADTCKGIQVFEIVHVVGATLSIVAGGLEQELGGHGQSL